MAPIFLDYHSTSPTDPRVLAAMLPWFGERFGNPHSVDHEWGWEAEEAVEGARRQVARLIGADPPEVIFTSGATEANNLALLGLAPDLLASGRTGILASALDHPSVTACLAVLARQGFTVTSIPIEPDGRIDPDRFAALLAPTTGLVTINVAQHEIGTIQPVSALADRVTAAGALLHLDATQAAGKMEPVFERADLISLSAHKLSGPKGIGALIARRPVRARLSPVIHGGGQEGGLRGGTLPVPLCVGFGLAADLARTEGPVDAIRISGLSDRLLAGLIAAGAPVTLHGSRHHRLPGNLNLRVQGVAATDLIALVRPRIAISAGAACSAARRIPSPILSAIGLDPGEAAGAIRIGLGRFTTEDEIESAIEVLIAAARRLAPW